MAGSLVSSILGKAQIAAPKAQEGRSLYERAAMDGDRRVDRHQCVVLLSKEAVAWLKRRALALSEGDVPVITVNAIVRDLVDRRMWGAEDVELPEKRLEGLERQKGLLLYEGQRAWLKSTAARLTEEKGWRVSVSMLVELFVREEMEAVGR